ncbi:peroxidase-related enzyme [Flagellimonas sp.]|uniref:peroxidase-related enzyme n=1 Tax=Flagellimonas sp. TaxID=2058762 RepID=UPI003B5024E8
MSWIKVVAYEDADPQLKRIYDRVKGPNNNVDNVLSIHSLRPHSLVGHMTLYKNVLHNSNNELPKWYLEAIGVYVSHLNQCDYCVLHHFEGLRKLLNDDEKSNSFMEAVKVDDLNSFLGEQFLAGMAYSKKLTLEHHGIVQEDIAHLKSTGFSDGQILEINQVASYFNYVNRTVLGLGVNTTGDILGLSPNESADPNNWSHK